jgi:hypothetical protein
VISRSALDRVVGAFGRWRSRSGRSSISDIEDYRRFCLRAANDPSAFACFRRDPLYTQILEHVTPNVGTEAAAVTLERTPDYRNQLEEFRRNDACGDPVLHTFGDIGAFSPTTLRYIKILSDLEVLFGDLTGFHVVEIGGGYGGQCRLIRTRFSVASYTIFDLPEPAALTRRYLDALGIRDVALNPPGLDGPIDLALSNYALSEIRLSRQDGYLRNVLLRAARGYMIWNATALRRSAKTRLPAADQPYAAEAIAAMIPGARIERNVPLLLSDDVARRNVLIHWP